MTAAEEEFDYIVTGAGSAGCAVAARLSESGRHRVLLLEAGGKDRNPWIHVPMGFSRLFADPSVNWMYESEPEADLFERLRAAESVGRPLGDNSFFTRVERLVSPMRSSSRNRWPINPIGRQSLRV